MDLLMVFLSFAFLSPAVILVCTLSEAGSGVQVEAGAWLLGQIRSAAPSSCPWVGMSSFLCWQGEQSLAWQLSGSAVTFAG